jgi:hypothetical protein
LIGGLLVFGCVCLAQQPQIPILTQDFVRVSGTGSTIVQDPAMPVSFELPAGWYLTTGMRWGTHETTLSIFDNASGATATFYYQYPIVAKIPVDLDAALRAGMEAKVKQRRDREGLKNYHVRAGSVQTSVVDGRPALSFIGDFTGPGRRAMSEYMLRVLGSDAKAEFFVQMPAGADLGAFTTRLSGIIQTLRIP